MPGFLVRGRRRSTPLDRSWRPCGSTRPRTEWKSSRSLPTKATAARVWDRPALDRMRDLAERHGFEVLLTYCTDRLARKFVLQALILDELERFGVKTIFIEGGAADDPLSKLMHQITGAVAEFERAKITERYRRGKV